MTDNLSPDDRVKTMRAVKSKGTRLERQLFAMIAGMGVSGWRKHADNVIGKPDVIFELERVAVFIDGCFWHGCSHCNRPMPQTNQEYWERKIQRNIERDERTQVQLEGDGWMVVRIWEHEMRQAETRLEARMRIKNALSRFVP